MASTRNRNTSTDYKIMQQQNKNMREHSFYEHSQYGRPISEAMPNVGYTPSHMSRDALSNNPIDIESTLYGIGSSNLVKPCETPYPSLKKLYFKDYFERNKNIIMPYPYVNKTNQRPFLV